MSIDAAIDISNLAAGEFATGEYLAEPTVTINGEGIEIVPPSVEYATGACIAEPVVTVNGECIELAAPSIAWGSWRTLSNPTRTMAGTGVVLHAFARADLPGDTGKIVDIGYFVDFSGYPRIVDIGAPVGFILDVKGVEIDRCRWTFGDGRTSTVFAPLHSYRFPGRYTVKLEAWSVDEEYSSIEKLWYIQVVRSDRHYGALRKIVRPVY